MEGSNLTKTIALMAVLFIAPSVWGGPKSLYLTNLGHYIKKHKVEVIADIAMVASSAADVETSIRAQRTPGMCETNVLLPCHPSRAQLWGVKLPGLIFVGVSEHYLVKWSNEPDTLVDGELDRFGKASIETLLPAIWCTANAVVAHDNAKKIQ